MSPRRPGAGAAAIVRLALCTTLIVLSFAMAAPVLAVLLQQQGYTSAQVDAFAMLPFLMIVLLIPWMPRLLGRWGLLPAYRGGATLQLARAGHGHAGGGVAGWRQRPIPVARA